MAYVRLPEELGGFATRAVSGRITGFEFSVFAGEVISCGLSPAKSRRRGRAEPRRRLHLRSDQGDKRFDLRGVPADMLREGDMAAVIAILPNNGDHGPIIGVANLDEDERVDFRWREGELLRLLTGQNRDYRHPRVLRRFWASTALMSIGAGALSYLAMAAYLDPQVLDNHNRLQSALELAWRPETFSAVALASVAVAVTFGLLGVSRLGKKARAQQKALRSFWARVGHALGYAADRREDNRPSESVRAARPTRPAQLAGPLLSPSRLLPAPGKAVSAQMQRPSAAELRREPYIETARVGAQEQRVSDPRARVLSERAAQLRASGEAALRERQEARRRAEEETRLRAEEEARRRAEEEARLDAEEEARLSAEEEARLRAEEEARLRAEEEARHRAEEEARFRAQEEARRRAKAEARRRAEEEERRRAEEEARRRAEEEARLRAEEEARLRAEEEARLRAEEEARLRAEEEARLRAEEEARLRAEEEARFRAQEEARRRAEEQARRRAEEQARLRAEEEARFRAEEESRRRALQELRRREQDEQELRYQEQKARRAAERARAAAALARLEARERARQVDQHGYEDSNGYENRDASSYADPASYAYEGASEGYDDPAPEAVDYEPQYPRRRTGGNGSDRRQRSLGDARDGYAAPRRRGPYGEPVLEDEPEAPYRRPADAPSFFRSGPSPRRPRG